METFFVARVTTHDNITGFVCKKLKTNETYKWIEFPLLKDMGLLTHDLYSEIYCIQEDTNKDIEVVLLGSEYDRMVCLKDLQPFRVHGLTAPERDEFWKSYINQKEIR